MSDKTDTGWPKVMWNFSAGGFCGVFMPRHVMQKLVRLQARHEEQVRAILKEHQSELELSGWTINDEWHGVGCQVTTHYVDGVYSVEGRIDLFRPQQPERVEVWPNERAAKQAAEFQAAERTKRTEGQS